MVQPSQHLRDGRAEAQCDGENLRQCAHDGCLQEHGRGRNPTDKCSTGISSGAGLYMSENNHFDLYTGDGTTLSSRSVGLPQFRKTEQLDDPRLYAADKPLRDAVNVALALGQPLLLTGEPGTGKTQLASSVAYELNLPAPLVFNTKTTSTAQDLFY